MMEWWGAHQSGGVAGHAICKRKTIKCCPAVAQNFCAQEKETEGKVADFKFLEPRDDREVADIHRAYVHTSFP